MERREFFKVVAASGAAAAAAGCGRATERILPYVIPPDNLVPGVASWFSTVCRECPAGCGVMARNRDGRIVKVEGNPDHPVNRGTLCIRGQASLQGLYNPDRIRGPLRRDAGGVLTPAKWPDAEKALSDAVGALVKSKRGGRIAVVSQLETGSLGRLMDRWGQAMGARPRVTYEPFACEPIRAANRAVFGRDALPGYDFAAASVVLSFGADFLETWLSPVEYAGGFAAMHTLKGGKAGNFIHVEPRLSLTAANADEWVRNSPGTEGALALAVLKVVLDEKLAAPGVDVQALGAAVKTVDIEAVAKSSGVTTGTIKHIARAFAKGKPSLAVGGGVAAQGRDATRCQMAVNLLNHAVGNIGKTVRFGPDLALGKAGRYADMLELARAMARGEVDLLLLVHVNPLYSMPPKAGFAEALKKVPMVVSFSTQMDETTAQAHLVLPDLHPLESWGDYTAAEGAHGLMQPVMSPVFDSKAFGDVLLSVGRDVLQAPEGKGPLPWKSFDEYLRAQWQSLAREFAPGKPFDLFWEESLRRGGAWKSVTPVSVQARAGALAEAGASSAPAGDAGGFALLVTPSGRFYDGRGANKPWLQETPDAMTQIVWESWIELPALAAVKLGITEGDLVKVTSPHGSIELPAYLSESIHPAAAAIPLGQGHTAYGRYAKDRGANPTVLLPADPDPASGGLQFLSVRVTVEKTGKRRALAIPQATADQDERELAQHVLLPAAREQELRGRVPEHANLPSMYPDHVYPQHRWGMAIDLDSCIGCQACVVACFAENNVATVGKEQVAYGRGMQWLRLERWHEGKPSHPETIFLPMLCQHCEVAPCEPVCPVFAAYRTEEGLNGQVYNRCVGTRYCGNNCPYHVRRFNWFQSQFPEPLELQLNPDVTVRQLGVMEKCTMCIQRIIAGKDRAKDEKRPVKDGEIVTACQQTCPTQAIVFGDLKDPQSRVSKLSKSPRGYHVLEEIGTRPAVTYLKKVTREHDKK
jgi:molybdopterin-containing oxidoreductase family iron-sulfur binding subunit